MFFDLDEAGRETVREALRQRPSQEAPIETLRLLAHRLVAECTPYIEFSSRSEAFIQTIERSESLKARARAIRDEIANVVALALAESFGEDKFDDNANLAASLLVAVWTTAFIRAHQTFRDGRDSERANAAFLAVIDRGTAGVGAALAGTRYVKPGKPKR